THEERTVLIKDAHSILDLTGLKHIPIVAGAGASSTRESIVFAKEAAAEDTDFVKVITPGCYASTPLANHAAVKQYLFDIAEASLVPVIVYNLPGVSGGINLDSEMVVAIVKASPYLAGVKLTCASVEEVTRITAVVGEEGFQAKYPRR
ncbi:aldolase, partial [Pleomassaria siparia CBS 279.74]